MNKRNLVLLAGAVVLCLGAYALKSRACDGNKASASNSACVKTEQASACAQKAAIETCFREAPGTKAQFEQVDGGVQLILTAADAKYVPVVQKAMLQHLDEMKAQVAGMNGACPHAASMKAGGTCPYAKAAMEKASGASCCAGHASTEKASMEKSSGACTAKASAQCTAAAGVEKASMGEQQCPEWMRALCSAKMCVQNTKTGVTVTWTVDKPEQVNSLRAASEQLQAQLAQL